MSKTIVALYDTYDEAQRAVDALQAAGIDSNEISVLGHGGSQMGGSMSGETRTNADRPLGTGLSEGSTTGTGTGRGATGLGTTGTGIGDPMATPGVTTSSFRHRDHDIPGIGTARVGGPISSYFGGGSGGQGRILDALRSHGVPESDAHAYAEGVRRGGTLLMLQVDEDQVPAAIDVLERHEPVDIEQRTTHWQSSGWTRFDESAGPYGAAAIDADRQQFRSIHSDQSSNAGVTGAGAGATTGTITGRDTDTNIDSAADRLRDVNAGREERIPVVEESLSVGKREVARGRVRVHSRVVETPVSEQVNLRNEEVTIERRPVSNPTTAAGAEAFRERTVEVTETDEEAVVAKQARVAEEVVIRKDVQDRVETVSDTVRRTEVEVEDDRANTDLSRNTTRDKTGKDRT